MERKDRYGKPIDRWREETRGERLPSRTASASNAFDWIQQDVVSGSKHVRQPPGREILLLLMTTAE